MVRHLHGSVPEVLHGEASGGRWTPEDVGRSVGLGATLRAEVRVGGVDGLLVGQQARAVARAQLRQCGAILWGEGDLRGGDTRAGCSRTLL